MTVLAPPSDPEAGDEDLPAGGTRRATRDERLFAERLARGEESAFEEIRTEYSRVLEGYLGQLLGDRATAQDVLQEVMVEAWRRGASFDPERGSLLSWLFMLARSRGIDQLRRRVPEPRDPASAALLLERDAVQEDMAERLGEQWRVAHLLRQLPSEEARLLRMRFQAGMSQSEIAAETGIALGTVKMRMVSGLARLRELLEREESRGAGLHDPGSAA